MKRKICLVLTLIMLLSIFLGACTKPSTPSETDSQNEEKPKLSLTAVEGTLTVANRGEPATLNPYTHSDSPSHLASRQLYDTLVYNNEIEGIIEPRLAERWEQIDDLTIRFYLRKDVVSHAGDPVTANDVKFSIMLGKESTQKAYIWRPFNCDACKVIDDYTVDVVTKEPYAPALMLLSTDGASIICEKSYKDAGSPEEYDRNPKGGTGPYVLKEWIAGDRIVYEANENYWGEKPYFKKLVIRNISDDTTRALALESGDIDICQDILPAQVKKLDENPDIDIVKWPSLSTTILGLNCQHKPLNDIRVRKALRYALDIPGMVDIAYSGQRTPADGPFTPAMTVYAPPKEDEKYTQDIEKAKELLVEAGYPDGFTIKLWTNENQARIDLCEMIQNAWAKIGVKTEVQIMEFATFISRLDAGEHDAYMLGWGPVANDGDFIHDTFYSTSPYHDNMAAYKNARFDEIVDAARIEFDPEKRKEYYAEVQSIMRKDLPWLPIDFAGYIIGTRATLSGYRTQSQPRFDMIVPKE